MKKAIALILALVMGLSLCACGSKSLTLEDLSDIYVQDNNDTRASFTFADGTMTVEIIQYVESAASPTGKIAGNRDTYTMPYTLEGENYVTVDGTKYYYEIDKEDYSVTFSVKFMGLATKFDFGYVL